jgi:hypothetical protein
LCRPADPRTNRPAQPGRAALPIRGPTGLPGLGCADSAIPKIRRPGSADDRAHFTDPEIDEHGPIESFEPFDPKIVESARRRSRRPVDR